MPTPLSADCSADSFDPVLYPYHMPDRWKLILAWLGLLLGAAIMLIALFVVEPGYFVIGFGFLLPGGWFLQHERREKKGAFPLKRHWFIVTVIAVVSIVGGYMFATSAVDRWFGTYYDDCDAARAAGAAPLAHNSPGYRPELDHDSDGIACER